MLRSNIRQMIAVLSLIVVLGVFWCLKLTGITMAGEAFCGIDEHVHGEKCPTAVLICEQKEAKAHIHSEKCILRELVCGKKQSAAHVHDESCLQRELTCGLEEQEGHTHDDSCEVIFILEGYGSILEDGTKKTVQAGDCLYCPKGGSHSLVNDSDADLVFCAVVPKQ